MARSYFAITTVNAQQSGWYIVAEGDHKEKTLATGIKALNKGQARDITTDTELKNLIVVSKSKAMREYGISKERLQTWDDPE